MKVPKTEILTTFAGLRPGREGGARIKAEESRARRLIVHNYGARGTGYQARLRMAIQTVSLALPHLVQNVKNPDVVDLMAVENQPVRPLVVFSDRAAFCSSGDLRRVTLSRVNLDQSLPRMDLSFSILQFFNTGKTIRTA